MVRRRGRGRGRGTGGRGGVDAFQLSAWAPDAAARAVGAGMAVEPGMVAALAVELERRGSEVAAATNTFAATAAAAKQDWRGGGRAAGSDRWWPLAVSEGEGAPGPSAGDHAAHASGAARERQPAGAAGKTGSTQAQNGQLSAAYTCAPAGYVGTGWAEDVIMPGPMDGEASCRARHHAGPDGWRGTAQPAAAAGLGGREAAMEGHSGGWAGPPDSGRPPVHAEAPPPATSIPLHPAPPDSSVKEAEKSYVEDNRARELRPGDASVGQTVQTQEPADPQALGAAAGIERLGERQGLPDVQAVVRQEKRCRTVSDSKGEDDSDPDVHVYVDYAPAYENQKRDDTSRDALGVSCGDMNGVSAPPAFQAAACGAKPTSGAEAECLCADGTCHCLDLILSHEHSNHSSTDGASLEAERVLKEAIVAGLGKDSKARLCRAPVYPKSISLTARDGEPFTEITADYTRGSAAQDDKIPKIYVVAGEDHIAAKDLHRLPPRVSAALQVMRNQCGYDLLRLRGQGSYGVVVEVIYQGEHFAVKLGTCAYSDQSARRNVLVEAALLDFGEKIQKGAQNSRADAIGPFAPRLRPWYGCPAVLINTEGQRFAAFAMDLADSSARVIFDGLEKRFRAENYNDPQEDVCLLRDLRSLLKGCLRVVLYMHRAGLAHCDLKPDNMLMKKLDATPPHDSLLVWCKVRGQVYQIWVCDFGHARWSGKGEKAAHVFCADGKMHSNNDIDDAVGREPNSVEGVGFRELQVLFGLGLRNSQEFRHPGPPTEWIRCPDFDRTFEKGQGDDQRKSDQAADIWALGAMCARLVAAPPFSGKEKELVKTMQQWQAQLFQFSSRAHASVRSAVESAWKRQKVADSPSSFGSSRAVKASTAAVASTKSCRSPHQPEFWLEVMVRENYHADPGVVLSSRINGAKGKCWGLLLDFVQNLLSYSSEVRRRFAGGALTHPFFDSPDLNTTGEHA
jgi:serine/threonine protein kinase